MINNVLLPGLNQLEYQSASEYRPSSIVHNAQIISDSVSAHLLLERIRLSHRMALTVVLLSIQGR